MEAAALELGAISTDFLGLFHKPLGLCGVSFLQSLDSDLPMSRSIGEALADDTTKGTFGATFILDADRTAMTISEIELCKIAVKMPLGAVLIDALHAALEDREITLDGVGVAVAALPLFDSVVDGLVGRELLADAGITGVHISH